MSSKYFVHVSNISPTTTEPKLHDFFTFCGTIESIDFKGADGESTVYFEKPSAVTTALMLNGGTLEGAQLTVKTDDQELPDEDRDGPHPDGVPFHQSDKPRAGIAAEYLAMGYTLSDSILQRAIHLDNQKGISKRFLSYFNTLDTTVGAKALGPDQTVSGKVQSTLSSATDRARSVDEQKGYSKSANDYYSKAIASPSGQKVKLFYTTAAKRLFDIHEEARRIAKSKAGEPVAATPTPDSASNADQKSAQPTPVPEKA